MKKIIIEENKLGDITYWDFLFNTKENDFKKLKKETKHDILSGAYKKAPISIRRNILFLYKAIEYSHLYLFDIDNEIKNLQFCTEYIKLSSFPSLTGMPEEYHEQLFKSVVIKNPWTIKDIFYNKNLRNYTTKEAVFDLVKENPQIYKHLLEYKFRRLSWDIFGYDLAEVAALEKPLLLLDMKKSIARKVISKHINIGLELFKNHREVFELLPLKYRSDKLFVSQCIANISQYKSIGKNLLFDKDIVLKIRYFHDLELPQEIIEDKEVAQHILSYTSTVHPKIKDCDNYTVVELVSELIKNDKNIYLYNHLKPELKKDINIIISLLYIGSYTETIYNKNKSYFDLDRTQTIEKSVLLLLPDDIQELLKNEFESTVGKLISTVSQEEYLSFVKSYYLDKNLNKELPNKDLNYKKKIKI